MTNAKESMQNFEGQGSTDLSLPLTKDDRGQWTSRVEFLLSCVGMSVGIGNIWRFPYLAYKNGGAAFLIPYFLLLLLVGKPMFFLEVAIGQFASASPIVLWKCCPIGKGIGIAMQVVVFLVSIYYNVIVTYTIFFLFACFATDVPWKDCYDWWGADQRCHVRKLNATRPCLQMNGTTITHLDTINGTCNSNVTFETASTQYWRKYVLHIEESSGIGDLGGIRWDLCLCLLLAWIIVFLCLMKGVKSTGKVWKAAAEQMFYSLSLSWGVLMTFGSYNGFRNKTHIDSVFVSLIDFATSLIGCLAIFSVLGYLAKQLNISVDQVAAKGPGLTFEVYPEALALLPISPLWSFLFFFMLFTLGLDSEFGCFESILSCIQDGWPSLRKYKTHITLGSCILCFLLGLPCVTSGGQYFLNLMDLYSAGTSVMFIAFCEMVCLSWIYGANRLRSDIGFMLDYKLSRFWFVSWAVICPTFLGIIFLLSCIFYSNATYEDYVYPSWAEAVGLMMQCASILQIPIWALVVLYEYYKKGDIMGAFSPTDDWGPADPEIRREWKENWIRNQQSNKFESYSSGIDNYAMENVMDTPKIEKTT